MRKQALSGLPVAALRLPPDVLERLEALGLWTIGDVLRLPRETLASRFGVILPQRLDQALGLLPETFICERLKEPLSAVREWEVPIDDRFAVDLVCRQMLRELLSMAERHGMGLQELEGELRTETGPVTIEIRLVEPTRDERHLAQLVELQLERRTWSGGVVAVRWAALRLGRSGASSGLLGSATIPKRKPHGRSTPWSIDSAAAWRPRPCCESSSFPTHSPSTWSGSSPGRTPNRRRQTGSRCHRNSLAAVRSDSWAALSRLM